MKNESAVFTGSAVMVAAMATVFSFDEDIRDGSDYERNTDVDLSGGIRS
jgi:hypothetical protein